MLTFRKAENVDIYLLESLANEIWLNYYPGIITTDQIRYMLQLMYSHETIQKEMQDGTIWEIIEEDAVPLGFLSCTVRNNEVKLNKLYLKIEHHGKGYGRVTLQHVIDFAKQNHFKKIYLTVNKNNDKAIKAYEKAGFVCTNSVVNDIGGGFVMDDYIYSYWIE
jgi:diamine N-acetyltransferase